MQKKADIDPDKAGDEEFKVEDRRHWTREDVADDGEAEVAPAKPTLIDEYRQRTEAAEEKLQEYIEAFKTFREEQDRVRQRLQRDVDRRVELKFAEVVGALLDTVDNLDLALSHVRNVPESKPLADGVELARNGFLATLEQAGVQKIVPDGQAFDPNEAEAMRVDPVDDAEQDGVVTETLRAGYRLGDKLIRPARVAVGRHVASGS